MSLEPAELSPREAAELILSLGGGPAAGRARVRAPAPSHDTRAPRVKAKKDFPRGGGGGGGERATATPRRPPGAPRPARPRTDEPIVPSSGKPERKRSRLDLTEHLTRDATPPLLPSPPVASRRPDEPERKRRRRAPVRIQPDVEDDARMGNRGVLGLERLSRAQQREFWRLAARGKSAPEEAEDEEAKLSKEKAKGEDADDERTKVAGVDPARARGRFRGVTRYKRTGRYEAHIWDRGRQKHLGSFADAAAAAAAYDKTAIKFRGWDASPLNFPAESYAADDEFRRDLATLTKGEFVAKTCAAGRAGRRAGGGGPGDASASAKDPRSTEGGADPRPSGLTLADALVRAQMLEDPGCAPKPQHVLTLAPPGCAETSHSGSESGSGGSGAGSGTNSETNSVSDSDSRDDALDPRRNVAVDPPTGSTPLGTPSAPWVGTPSAPPPPRPADVLALARAFIVGGVVTAEVATHFPAELLAAASRELELANARGRAVGCRGGCRGGADDDGEASEPRPNPATRAAARAMADSTVDDDDRGKPATDPPAPPAATSAPLSAPSRHPPRHPTSPPRASPCTPARPPRARSNAGFKRGDTSSSHKGVTRHRRSGRWEAHMWSRELGKQLYLGGFDAECEAARAFDVCSLKKWRDERGASATAAGTSPAGTSKAPGLNFPPGEYRDLVPALDSMSLEGVIAAVRQGKLREHSA